MPGWRSFMLKEPQDYTTPIMRKSTGNRRALKKNDFVYLHIEASDEAGHEGDVELKIKTIEYLDRRVVKYILEETQKWMSR